MIPTFIEIDGAVINLEDLLYITKVKEKTLYVARFTGTGKDSSLFLSEEQYKEFIKLLRNIP